MIATDPASQLSEFMEYLLGNVAKAVNGLRRRRGPVWERRYSAEPILDPSALGERMVYLLANPVRANLVQNSQDWPGLTLWASGEEAEIHRFRVFDSEGYEQARRRAEGRGKKVSQETYYAEERVRVVPVGVMGIEERREEERGELRGRVLRETLRRVQGRLQEERMSAGRRVLGIAKVLQQDPEARPEEPKRSRRPVCHASLRATRKAFRRVLDGMKRAYMVASAAFRSGQWGVEFPLYVHRPPGVLILSVAWGGLA